MCLSNVVFLPPLIFLSPNFDENMHDFRSPSFFQGRRLRPCFNGVDAPAGGLYGLDALLLMRADPAPLNKQALKAHRPTYKLNRWSH